MQYLEAYFLYVCKIAKPKFDFCYNLVKGVFCIDMCLIFIVLIILIDLAIFSYYLTLR